MELSVILFIIVIGFLTGILASLIGIGGGLIIVPSMIFFFDLPPSQATLISSFVIIFISFSSSYKNYKFRFQYVIPFLRCFSKIVETLGIIANAKLPAVPEFS